jgi:hypothetical protein
MPHVPPTPSTFCRPVGHQCHHRLRAAGPSLRAGGRSPPRPPDVLPRSRGDRSAPPAGCCDPCAPSARGGGDDPSGDRHRSHARP